VTSCAKLSGELSQDCPIIYICVYIYIVYHSMVILSQTYHHYGRLNHIIYIYSTLFLSLHVCSYHIPRTRFVLSPTFQKKENAGQFLAVASRRIFGSAPANFKELTAVTS
jgi:hypothetical protein